MLLKYPPSSENSRSGDPSSSGSSPRGDLAFSTSGGGSSPSVGYIEFEPAGRDIDMCVGKKNYDRSLGGSAQTRGVPAALRRRLVGARGVPP